MLDLDSLPVETSNVASVPSTDQDQSARFTYYISDVVRIVVMTALAVGALVILFGSVSSLNRNFASPVNIRNMLLQISIYGLVAVGMTFVILNRGIDLSVGPMVAFAGILAALSYKDNQSIGAAFSVAIIAGLIVGFVQGLLIGVLEIPSYIVTLGGAALLTSLSLQATQGTIVLIQGDDYRNLVTATTGSVPPLFVMILLALLLAQALQIVLYIVMRRAPGLNTISQTDSPDWTARIVVAAGKIATYTLMGFLAAISGVLLSARLASASANVGADWTLFTVGAVVIGGASVFSGKGWFVGTFIGLLVVGVIQNGILIAGLSAFAISQNIAIAAAIALLINRLIEMLLVLVARSTPALRKPIL